MVCAGSKMQCFCSWWFLRDRLSASQQGALKLCQEDESAPERQLVDFIASNTDIGAFIFASSLLMRTALNFAIKVSWIA